MSSELVRLSKRRRQYIPNAPVKGDGMSPETLTEIARSFSYKHNAGNYESRDFFCSQKIECPLSQAEEVSEKLYQFCRAQVMKAVDEYLQRW